MITADNLGVKVPHDIAHTTIHFHHMAAKRSVEQIFEIGLLRVRHQHKRLMIARLYLFKPKELGALSKALQNRGIGGQSHPSVQECRDASLCLGVVGFAQSLNSIRN